MMRNNVQSEQKMKKGNILELKIVFCFLEFIFMCRQNPIGITTKLYQNKWMHLNHRRREHTYAHTQNKAKLN